MAKQYAGTTQIPARKRFDGKLYFIKKRTRSEKTANIAKTAIIKRGDLPFCWRLVWGIFTHKQLSKM